MELVYLLHNIAGRSIDILISAEFYDKDNNLVYKSEQKTFDSMPKDYTEQWPQDGPSGFNIFTYDGENMEKIDHATIYVVEKS